MASNESKKIILKSNDGIEFPVDEEVAKLSETIRPLIEEENAESGIPLPDVDSKILGKVIEYCNKHVDKSMEEELKIWDCDFVKVDQGTLFGLIMAANYLNIKGLLDITCQAVADIIVGKTPEEIRQTFNIENDFTPEEEEEIRRENQWAFE